MPRRLLAFALFVVVASSGLAMAARGPKSSCAMGTSCPLRAAGGAQRCPAQSAWSVELGCCQGVPATPAPPPPVAGGPVPEGGSAIPAETPAVAVAGLQCMLPAASPRASRLAQRDGLFTVFRSLLI